MPHEFLGGETPHERLTGRPFNYDRLRAFGTECYVHQFKQQRGSNSKFHPYAKRGFIVGHDRTSTAWHIWLTAEEKMVTSAHVTFTPEADTLDFLETGSVFDYSSDTVDITKHQIPTQQPHVPVTQQTQRRTDRDTSASVSQPPSRKSKLKTCTKIQNSHRVCERTTSQHSNRRH